MITTKLFCAFIFTFFFFIYFFTVYQFKYDAMRTQYLDMCDVTRCHQMSRLQLSVSVSLCALGKFRKISTLLSVISKVCSTDHGDCWIFTDNWRNGWQRIVELLKPSTIIHSDLMMRERKLELATNNHHHRLRYSFAVEWKWSAAIQIFFANEWKIEF